MAQGGVAGEGRGQGVPAARNASPVWSMARLIRIRDHHMPLDYFVSSFSSLFLLAPSRTHRTSSFHSNVGAVRRSVSPAFL